MKEPIDLIVDSRLLSHEFHLAETIECVCGYRRPPSCEWCEKPSRGTAVMNVFPYAVRLSCGSHGLYFIAVEDEER